MKSFLYISPDVLGDRWFEQRVANPMIGRHVKIAIVAIPPEAVGKFAKR